MLSALRRLSAALFIAPPIPINATFKIGQKDQRLQSRIVEEEEEEEEEVAEEEDVDDGGDASAPDPGVQAIPPFCHLHLP
ncbi:Zinc finger, C4 type (two domains) [Popillia japonica]